MGYVLESEMQNGKNDQKFKAQMPLKFMFPDLNGSVELMWAGLLLPQAQQSLHCWQETG